MSLKLLVDVHTHVYLPRYASVLRSRTSVPRILSRSTPEGKTEERLVILDHEPSGGRPVGAQVGHRALCMSVQWLDQLIVLEPR
jgi:aminocarboxymuconate-semialdehyde decarboxylase